MEGVNKNEESVSNLENKFALKEGGEGVYKDVYVAQIKDGKIISSEKVDFARIEGNSISFRVGDSEGTASNTEHSTENERTSYAIIDYASDNFK